jgi:hypothetical protein
MSLRGEVAAGLSIERLETGAGILTLPLAGSTA